MALRTTSGSLQSIGVLLAGRRTCDDAGVVGEETPLVQYSKLDRKKNRRGRRGTRPGRARKRDHRGGQTQKPKPARAGGRREKRAARDWKTLYGSSVPEAKRAEEKFLSAYAKTERMVEAYSAPRPPPDSYNPRGEEPEDVRAARISRWKGRAKEQLAVAKRAAERHTQASHRVAVLEGREGFVREGPVGRSEIEISNDLNDYIAPEERWSSGVARGWRDRRELVPDSETSVRTERLFPGGRGLQLTILPAPKKKGRRGN